jgi:hypothetical protein
MHFNSAGRGGPAGIADMQALAASAIAALQHANLLEEAQYIHAQVLTRAPEDLLERTVIAERAVWTFKPMVELLLYELRYLATAADLPIDVRRDQIRWTIEVAGF